MPVYMFTYHGHSTWMPDHRRGYVKDQTVLPPDPNMAEAYRRRARQPMTDFSRDQQGVMLCGVYDACKRRGWRLHCFACEPSHVHAIVSWEGFVRWEAVRDKLKNLLSYFLGRFAGVTGRQWFSRKASRRRVRDRKHLDYVMDEYLPKHGGVFWREGDPAPRAVEELLDNRK